MINALYTTCVNPGTVSAESSEICYDPLMFNLILSCFEKLRQHRGIAGVPSRSSVGVSGLPRLPLKAGSLEEMKAWSPSAFSVRILCGPRVAPLARP